MSFADYAPDDVAYEDDRIEKSGQLLSEVENANPGCVKLHTPPSNTLFAEKEFACDSKSSKHTDAFMAKLHRDDPMHCDEAAMRLHLRSLHPIRRNTTTTHTIRRKDKAKGSPRKEKHSGQHVLAAADATH